MKKEIDRHHLFHYLSLFLILSVGFVLFYVNRGFPQTQLNVALIICFLYVIWGIIHHYLKGDLHTRIVIEYSLIAALAFLLVRGAIIR